MYFSAGLIYDIKYAFVNRQKYNEFYLVETD